MKILVTLPLDGQQKKRIEKEASGAEFIYCPEQNIPEGLIADAEIILGNLNHPSQARGAKKLKWIQLNTAGTEGYCNTEYLPSEVLLTNATGTYGLAISEHMIGNLFMLKKKLHLYYLNQREHLWKNEGYVDVIEGSRILAVGMGDIGSTFLLNPAGK